MYGQLFSACIYGIDGHLIEVEVDISPGIPQTLIVGLPDTAVREAVQRVRAAIKNCRFSFPMQRVTINLAPADLRKEGSSFDLAIALGILTASGQLTIPKGQKLLMIGELSLDGGIRPVSGVLSMVDLAIRHGFQSVLVPADNVEEASILGGINVYGIEHLSQLTATPQQKGQTLQFQLEELHYTRSAKVTNEAEATVTDLHTEDYSDVIGQHHVKRAMTIAAAGMHNIMLIGPPGTGKTMLIRRLPTILSTLTPTEALEVTKIYSSSGKLTSGNKGLLTTRPFRSPHHSISRGGLIGGGSIPKPGEVSLAHHGVLFLDELPEFPRHVLELLRQPLEEQVVTISRSRAAFTFPAHFLLAISLNPCPCGFYGTQPDSVRQCTCTPHRIAQYRNRISGPLLDRIDMHVEVPRPSNLRKEQQNSLSSAEMEQAVEQATAMQLNRFAGTRFTRNSELSGAALHEFAKLSPMAADLLHSSFDLLSLSMRAYDRIIKLSRTIADLAHSDVLLPEHVAEAIQYRQLDREQELI